MTTHRIPLKEQKEDDPKETRRIEELKQQHEKGENSNKGTRKKD